MRPGIADQLDAIGRTLAEIVLPEIAAPYPKEILSGAIAALCALADTLPKLPEFLVWDAEGTGAVLAAALPLLDPGRAGAIRATLAERAPAAADLPGLERRQETLRGLLVTAMPAILAERGPAYRAMVDHMRARAERFPFAISATLPKLK